MVAQKKLSKSGANAVWAKHIPVGLTAAIRERAVRLALPSARSRVSLYDAVDGDPNHPAIRRAILDEWWSNPEGGGKRGEPRASALQMAMVVQMKLDSVYPGKRSHKGGADQRDAAFVYAVTAYYNNVRHLSERANGGPELRGIALRTVVTDPNSTLDVLSTPTSRMEVPPGSGNAVWWQFPRRATEHTLVSLENPRFTLQQSESVVGRGEYYYRATYEETPTALALAHWLAMAVPTPFAHGHGAARDIVANVDELVRQDMPLRIARMYGASSI